MEQRIYFIVYWSNLDWCTVREEFINYDRYEERLKELTNREAYTIKERGERIR